MKRKLVFAGGALALALPVYLGLANFQPLEQLFLYHDAWKAFSPLFALGNAMGIHSADARKASRRAPWHLGRVSDGLLAV
jgi:hypothetical protein